MFHFYPLVVETRLLIAEEPAMAAVHTLVAALVCVVPDLDCK
jgi:hypothetical protein